jgi:hypothetical protein
MYKKPPILYNYKNELRKIGYEIEYSGLEISEAVSCITQYFGGRVVKKNPYYSTVKDSQAGDFTVKIDSSFLYEKKYKNLLDKFGISELPYRQNADIEEKVGKFLGDLFSGFIPFEIVTPPVTLNDIDLFDGLIEELKKKNAEGTSGSLVYAFATHINPETPSLDIHVITDYLRAFFLLYEWLFGELKINFTRKLTNFIQPFDNKYIDLVLDGSYNPDLEEFINDYIRYNPRRDRPLDLYPLLAYLKPGIQAREKTGIVKVRPTFHYRLPNSEIDIKDWSLATEWNYWWLVEKLAYEKETLKDLSKQYLMLRRKFTVDFNADWKKIIDKWVKETK